MKKIVQFSINIILLVFLITSCELGDWVTVYEMEGESETSLSSNSNGGRYIALFSALQEAKKEDKNIIEKELDDGTIINGILDNSTGFFRLWIIHYPQISPVESTYQEGKMQFNEFDEITGGEYDEFNDYRDGRSEKYHFMFSTDGAAVLILGTGLEGQTIEIFIEYGSESIHAKITWIIPDKQIQINTEEDYFHDGLKKTVSQIDKFDTDWSPDEEYELTINPDGSGNGTGKYYLKNNKTETYNYIWDKNGHQQMNFTIEDPSTIVSPDGIGSAEINPDGSGKATYKLFYDNGSIIEVEQEFNSDGTYEQKYTYDNADTRVNPDEEGEIYFFSDGSGEGTSTFYHDDGSVYVCNYTLNPDDTYKNNECKKQEESAEETMQGSLRERNTLP